MTFKSFKDTSVISKKKKLCTKATKLNLNIFAFETRVIRKKKDKTRPNIMLFCIWRSAEIFFQQLSAKAKFLQQITRHP